MKCPGPGAVGQHPGEDGQRCHRRCPHQHGSKMAARGRKQGHQRDQKRGHKQVMAGGQGKRKHGCRRPLALCQCPCQEKRECGEGVEAVGHCAGQRQGIEQPGQAKRVLVLLPTGQQPDRPGACEIHGLGGNNSKTTRCSRRIRPAHRNDGWQRRGRQQLRDQWRLAACLPNNRIRALQCSIGRGKGSRCFRALAESPGKNGHDADTGDGGGRRCRHFLSVATKKSFSTTEMSSARFRPAPGLCNSLCAQWQGPLVCLLSAQRAIALLECSDSAVASEASYIVPHHPVAASFSTGLLSFHPSIHQTIYQTIYLSNSRSINLFQQKNR
jgi:hypothetical protein